MHRMRRGLLTAAVTGAVLLGTAAPSSAAECEFPKGWYTSNAELQYAGDLWAGKLEESLRTPSNTSNLVSGNATRTASLISALGRWAQALPANLPRC